MNIFSKQNPVEISCESLHDYRYIGEQMESLGLRLDAVRKALAQAKSEWARWYWQETLNHLLSQWRALPILHDGGAKIRLIPKWTISYNYWEQANEIAAWDILDKIFHSMNQPNLDASWDRVRTARIMKCNCQ